MPIHNFAQKWACLLCLTLIALLPVAAWAAPAAPNFVEVQQPDGTTFEIILRGDERKNWYETSDGYSVVEDSGTWYYATLGVDGNLVSNGISVGQANYRSLNSMPLHVTPQVNSNFEVDRPERRFDSASFGASSISVTQPLLVILVSYDDTAFTFTKDDFDASFFGATDSVKHYYDEVSYGGFTITPASESQGDANDGFIELAMNYPHPDPAGNFSVARDEWLDIVAAADPWIDFSAYDTNSDGKLATSELSIYVVLAGFEKAYSPNGTPSVWAHQWSNSTTLDGINVSYYAMQGELHNTHQATIGITCHELGHLMLGLPDLYDSQSSNGTSAGVGDWCLMASGSWNRTGSWSGDTPAHLSAWCKAEAGFTVPDDLVSVVASATLPNASTTPGIHRIWLDKYRTPLGERFLLENRQQTNYDAALPSSGMLIWHVDGSQSGSSNTDETHKLVDLEEAEGFSHLDADLNDGDAGDPFPGSTLNRTFDDASSPNAHDYLDSATGTVVSNISDSASVMTASLVPAHSQLGDYTGYEGISIFGWKWGYSYSAFDATNDTLMTTLDGFEVLLDDDATVNFSWYTSLDGSTLNGLLHSESGFVGVEGWNRFMLATPQPFEPGDNRVMQLHIVNNSSSYPVTTDGPGTDSGTSYLSTQPTTSFTSPGYKLKQRLLLGGVGVDPDNVWVDYAHTGSESGTQTEPFNTLAEAYTLVNAGGTIHIAGGGATGEILSMTKAVTIQKD